MKYMAFYNHFDLNRWIILTSMNLIAILGYTYSETKVYNYVQYVIVNNTHDNQSFKGGGGTIIIYFF